MAYDIVVNENCPNLLLAVAFLFREVAISRNPETKAARVRRNNEPVRRRRGVNPQWQQEKSSRERCKGTEPESQKRVNVSMLL